MSLLTDSQHFEGLLFGVKGDPLNVKLQVYSAIFWAVVKVVYPQLPQTESKGGKRKSSIPTI